MKRIHQLVLILSWVALSWLGFMIVHELGHVLAAWLTGGTVSRVMLHPLQISWTALASNPHPRAVAWGGPMVGSLLPLGLLAVACACRLPGSYLLQFFAGFCLLSNGLYLLVDAFERGGDAGTLLRHGAATWQLFVFGLLAAPAGFWCWHGLGPHFGLGMAQGRVSRKATMASANLLVVVVLAELALS